MEGNMHVLGMTGLRGFGTYFFIWTEEGLGIGHEVWSFILTLG